MRYSIPPAATWRRSLGRDPQTSSPSRPPPLILVKKNRKMKKSRQGKRQKTRAPLAQGLDITGNDKISSAIWCK